MSNKLKPPYKLIGIISIILIVLGAWWQNNQQNVDGHQNIINANAPLSFTKHAKCRMSCRGITEDEIRQVIREGVINKQKSNLNDKPCPSYAIEHRVDDGQMLRIVFGICQDQIKVITCIDIEKDFDCDCK